MESTFTTQIISPQRGGAAKYYLALCLTCLFANLAEAQELVKRKTAKQVMKPLMVKPNSPKALDRPKSATDPESVPVDWKCSLNETVNICDADIMLNNVSEGDNPVWFFSPGSTDYNNIDGPTNAYTYRFGNVGIGSNRIPYRTLSLFGKDCNEGTDFLNFSAAGIRIQTQELNNNDRHFWDIVHSNDRLGLLYDNCETPSHTFRPIGLGIGVDPINALDVNGGAVIGTGWAGDHNPPADGLLLKGKLGINTIAPKSYLQVAGGGVFGSDYNNVAARDGYGYFSKKLFVGTTDVVDTVVKFRVQDGSTIMRNNIEGGSIFNDNRCTALQLQSGANNRNLASGAIVYVESNSNANSMSIGVDIEAYSRTAPQSGPIDLQDTSSRISFGNVYGIRSKSYGGFNNFGIYSEANNEAFCDPNAVVSSFYGKTNSTAKRSFGLLATSYNNCCSGFSDNLAVYGRALNGGRAYSIFGDIPNANMGALQCVPTTVAWAGYFNGDVYGATFQTPSDQNLKTNIKEVNTTLPLINSLKLKSYEFKPSERMDLPKGLQFGFMAQELEKTFPQWVKDSYIPDLLDTNGTVLAKGMAHKTVNYLPLIPLAIGGVQEVSKEVEALKTELALLKEKLSAEKASSSKGFSLAQNKPNPFSQTTEIGYQLSGEFGAAFILLYGVDGKFSKTYPLNSKENTLSIQSLDLPNGALYYSLVIDGSVKDTKIMILNR